MTEEEDGPAGIGHNQPPEPTPAEAVFARVAELVANANRWRTERERITDAEMAGAASRFMAQLRDARDDLKAAFAKEKEPFDAAIAAARERYRDPMALVDLALRGMVALNTDWLQREEDRLAVERLRAKQKADAAQAEAAQRAAEASKAGATVEAQLAAQRAEEMAAVATAAAARVPARAQVRDEMTARATSLRANWKAKVTDEALALRSYAKHPDVRAAALVQIVKTASREAQLAKDPAKAKPGIAYVNEARAT